MIEYQPSVTTPAATYMSQEAVWNSERVFPAWLQLTEEELTVEVQKFLQVSKDDRAFTPQVLRKVVALHLREVVNDDVTQGPHIFSLRGYHLLHDVTQFTGHEADNVESMSNFWDYAKDNSDKRGTLLL